MAYVKLKALYYQDERQYVEEYERRFTSEASVHLDFMIHEKPAFFVETRDVLRLAFEIEKVDKRVSRLSNLLPGIAREQYSKKCLIDEIVLTNKIEGVHSSRKEIGQALEVLEQQSEEKGVHTRFLGLTNKYLKLMGGEVIPLSTCSDVRSLYDELFLEEVIGEDPDNRPDGQIFRKGPVSIYSAAQKEIHQGVYPEEKVIQCMEQALAFLRDDRVEPLYRACIFHYLFEYIHPFYDGNGRLGRFILSYCISKELEPLLAYRISETIKEKAGDYRSAFDSCNDRKNLGDVTPFLLMQLRMILDSLDELEKSLWQRMTLWARYENIIPTLPGAENGKGKTLYSFLIQAGLFSEGGIPTRGLLALLNIKSDSTLKKMLAKIPERFLDVQKKGTTKFYQMNLHSLDEIILQQEMAKNKKQ